MTIACRRAFGFVRRFRPMARAAVGGMAMAGPRVRLFAGGWHALALRWRRPRRWRPRLAATVFERTVIRGPQMHLHLSAPASHTSREHWHRTVEPGHRTVMFVRHLRQTAATLRTLRMCWLKPGANLVRLDRGEARAIGGPPATGRSPIDGVARVAAARTARPWVSPRSAAEASPTTAQSRRVVRRTPAAFPDDWRRTLGHRPLSLQIPRTESPRDPEPGPAGFRGDRQGQPGPAAQIVWRETARPPSGSAERHFRPAPRSGPAGVTEPATGPSHDTPTRATAAEHRRTAMVGLADFEPGLIDRLADDVIRRVERRVRIERERRGLR